MKRLSFNSRTIHSKGGDNEGNNDFSAPIKRAKREEDSNRETERPGHSLRAKRDNLWNCSFTRSCSQKIARKRWVIFGWCLPFLLLVSLFFLRWRKSFGDGDGVLFPSPAWPQLPLNLSCTLPYLNSPSCISYCTGSGSSPFFLSFPL